MREFKINEQELITIKEALELLQTKIGRIPVNIIENAVINREIKEIEKKEPVK